MVLYNKSKQCNLVLDLWLFPGTRLLEPQNLCLYSENLKKMRLGFAQMSYYSDVICEVWLRKNHVLLRSPTWLFYNSQGAPGRENQGFHLQRHGLYGFIENHKQNNRRGHIKTAVSFKSKQGRKNPRTIQDLCCRVIVYIDSLEIISKSIGGVI